MNRLKYFFIGATVVLLLGASAIPVDEWGRTIKNKLVCTAFYSASSTFSFYAADNAIKSGAFYAATSGAGVYIGNESDPLWVNDSTLTATSVNVANTTDSSCYVGLYEDATGSQDPKSNANITYNSTTGAIAAQGYYSATAGAGMYIGDSTSPIYVQGSNITANITGNVTGNAGTATKLETARLFTVTDNDATNSQAAASSFDGSAAYTVKLPATIKATLTGNADTATTATTATNTLNVSTKTAEQIVAFYNGDHSGYNITNVGNVDGVDISTLAVGTIATSNKDNQLCRYNGDASQSIQAAAVYVSDLGSLYWFDALANIKIGRNSLDAITTGNINVAVGSEALTDLTDGSANTAIGYYAMFKATSATDNTAVGKYSGYDITDGTYNTTIGTEAGQDLTTGDYNIIIGYNACEGSLDTGSNNIVIGCNTALNNRADTNEIVIGDSAVGLGSNSTVIGNGSITAAYIYGDEVYLCEDAAGTLGDLNCVDITASGTVDGVDVSAHAADTTTAHGAVSTATASTLALRDAYAGLRADCYYLGTTQALWYYAENPSTYESIIVGPSGSTMNVISGSDAKFNTVVGYGAGAALARGYSNTLIGRNAGTAITGDSGSNGHTNTCVGTSAGATITTGTGNTCVGFNAAVNAATNANSTVIGSGAAGQGSNTIMLGNSSIDSTNGLYCYDTGIASPSDISLKKDIKPFGLGLEFLRKIHPIEFKYLTDSDETDKRQGFIAQEIQTALDGRKWNGLGKCIVNNEEKLAVSPTDLIPVLVNAIQEQQAQIDDLKKRIEKLEGK